MANHTISANTLFHFTKSVDNLRNILTHTFSPRFCLEHMDNMSQENVVIGIPMVCFCDIPLSQIKDHVNTYGDYAIGLSKDWAMSNGISPVLYLYKNSVTNEMINKFFNTAFKLDNALNNLNKIDGKFYEKTNYKPASAISDYVQLLSFTKSYKGNMWRGGQLIRNKTFYNEREWRFVPNISSLDSVGARMFIGKNDCENESFILEQNKRIESIKIKFSPKDIKYIIISKESERREIIGMIEEIKGDAYSMLDLKELNSKIISVEQIREDF